MKFSDMMGKGPKAAVDEVEATETMVPPVQRDAPPVPEAPIRFGASRTDAIETPPAVPAAPSAPPLVEGVVQQPSIAEVMAELTPRVGGPTAALASESELDATAWLEGLSAIDDDLLPR